MSKPDSNLTAGREGVHIRRYLTASLLLLVGTTLLAERLGLLPRAADTGSWDWIVFGGGALLIVAEFIRLSTVRPARFSTGLLLLGIILFGIGANALFPVSIIQLAPGAAILLGLALLIRNLL